MSRHLTIQEREMVSQMHRAHAQGCKLDFAGPFMTLSAVDGIRPDVYVGFAGFSNDWVRPVYGLLFYTNIAAGSASGPNTCQQRVMSCKR